MTHALLFACNFAHVALRAFQQRNVAHLRYAPVLPLSLFLAATEIYIIAQVGVMAITSNLAWHHVLVLALGGGLGCMLSMYLHDKVFKEK